MKTELQKFEEVAEQFHSGVELLEYLNTEYVIAQYPFEESHTVMPVHVRAEEIVATFLGLDYNKLEQERDQLFKNMKV